MGLHEIYLLLLDNSVSFNYGDPAYAMYLSRDASMKRSHIIRFKLSTCVGRLIVSGPWIIPICVVS